MSEKSENKYDSEYTSDKKKSHLSRRKDSSIKSIYKKSKKKKSHKNKIEKNI